MVRDRNLLSQLEGVAGKERVHSFGSDFEQENPVLGSVPKTPRKTTPGKAPGKQSAPGAEPDPVPPVPPVPSVPQLDPVPKGKFTWPSDVEHWKEDTLPRNHSKRLRFIR